jgi:hypothetical protein
MNPNSTSADPARRRPDPAAGAAGARPLLHRATGDLQRQQVPQRGQPRRHRARAAHHHERPPAAPAPHPRCRPGTPNPSPVRPCTGHARRRRHQAPRPPPPLRHPRTQTPNAAVVLGDGEGGHEFAGGETTASASRCRKSPAQREPPPVVSLAARRRRWRPIRAATVGSLSRPRPAASLLSGGGDATWTWPRSSGGDQGGIRSASEEFCTTRQGWGSRFGPSPDRVS